LSQVIVTQDKLLDKRQRSREQEKNIETNEQFAKWRRSDVTGPDAFRKLVGLAVMPILGLWAILGGIMATALGLLRAVFKAVGQILGGKRNLITDDK
jgi:hypothetical protein